MPLSPTRLARYLIALALLCALGGCATARPRDQRSAQRPFLIVLGIAQDGGVPQAGSFDHPAWKDPSKRRLVSCLGLIDPRSGKTWMFDATPDFREQSYRLHEAASELAPPNTQPVLSGIFITHAHIGHYTGLMFLGHESMGAQGTPVFAMPQMTDFLRTNGPWDQLVRYGNIALQPMVANEPVALAPNLRVTPLLVPHRQEYSEVVGFRIEGPSASALFIPDIDSWEEWDETGVRIEDEIAKVDVAYLDGTFFVSGEIPGRDMSGFPHPFITHSMKRFAPLPKREQAKIRFIHLNHTNPAQKPQSPAARQVQNAGMRIAQPLERFGL